MISSRVTKVETFRTFVLKQVLARNSSGDWEGLEKMSQEIGEGNRKGEPVI